MNSRTDVVVVDLTDTGKGARIAANLGADLVDPGAIPEGITWCLVYTWDGLELREGGVAGPVQIGSALERRQRVSRDDPLGRALGKGTRTVVDATAGLGTDMLEMLALGFSVVAIEESELICALLRDRLARSGSVAAGCDVYTGDATAILPTLMPHPDVVYIDPMFPGRRRASALPRKELVAMAKIAKTVDEMETRARALFTVAAKVATNRVVVKRLPEHAELAGAPSHSHRSKAVRYDVYLTGA